MSMYKIIALMGKAGSGKDSLMQGVLKEYPELHEIISFTTRPQREGEQNGVQYHFITGEEFGDKMLHGEMIEAAVFNDWFYGTGYDCLRSDCVNIGVFNPEGVVSLIVDPKVDVKVFYVRAGDKERLLRQLNREENPDCMEIVRRFRTDLLDFADIDFEYTELINENFNDFNRNVKIVGASAAGF